ncbi:MAG: SDR family NAD(P)-dependent oxidoreductase, partial [Pseudomonadota bacterium]
MKLPRTPSFRLDGLKALITGGSRGIGLGGAVALAEAGASVFIAARSANEVKAAAASLRAEGWDATGVPLDVTDTEAVRQVITEHGPFDILFNNAGTNKPGPYDAVSAEDFDLVQNLNVKAAFFVAQEVSKALIAAGKPGSIIHISSQMG